MTDNQPQEQTTGQALATTPELMDSIEATLPPVPAYAQGPPILPDSRTPSERTPAPPLGIPPAVSSVPPGPSDPAARSALENLKVELSNDLDQRMTKIESSMEDLVFAGVQAIGSERYDRRLDDLTTGLESLRTEVDRQKNEMTRIKSMLQLIVEVNRDSLAQ